LLAHRRNRGGNGHLWCGRAIERRQLGSEQIQLVITNTSLSPLPENVGVKYLIQVVSNRIKAAANSNKRIHQFYFLSRYAERRAEPGICDFTFGNPHEMPLPGHVEAIRRHAIPLNKDWFAYKRNSGSR
jgi:hypothetical protein